MDCGCGLYDFEVVESFLSKPFNDGGELTKKR